MKNKKKNLTALRFSISENGVIHVQAKELLNNTRVKKQIKALKFRPRLEQKVESA